MISVVVPVYGCKAAIIPLYERIKSTISKIDTNYEIIFVNDACPQNSWDVISELARSDKQVIGVNLSRNFGQHNAILAGLDLSRGDYVVVMDCDLQDRPEAIELLYNKLQEGYDIVWAKRVNRKDKKSTICLSKLFYIILNRLTDDYVDPTINNFSISRRKVIDAHIHMRDHNREYSVFQRWLGFKSAELEIEGDERAEGKSSYSVYKKIKLAISLIISQSNRPLYLAIYVGLAFVLFSLGTIAYRVISYFVTKDIPTGWTSLIISIYLVGGMILTFLGILGIYIGNIFNETKHRPNYVIMETLNRD